MSAQTKFNQSMSDPFNDQPPITDQRVLIIGGGNVGLSLALLLAQRGIASTLLEQTVYPTASPDDASTRHLFDSRNIALSRRTVQIYQTMGLWQNLADHACRIDQVSISEQGSFGKALLDKTAEGVESFGQIMENAWLGKKLLQTAQAHPLITLIDGATVTAIAQHRDSVTVTFTRNASDDAAGEQILTAALLVACDGQHSTARRLLEIGETRHDYGQMAIVGVVITDKPHEHIAIERFTPHGLVAALPLPDTGAALAGAPNCRRSVVWVCPRDEAQRYLDDDAHFLATLQGTFGAQTGTFIQAGKRGAYPLVKVLAKRQVQGRCVLMGNAAHTLHPVAGQGFNLCMRDADTLAQMLAQQALRGGDLVDARVLADYAKRRQADQKRVELFCDAVVHGFTHRNPLVKLARNIGLVAFEHVPKVKPLVATFAMGLRS